MRKLFSILLITLYSISLNAQTSNVPPEIEFKNFLSQANIFLMKGEDDKAVSCLRSCLKLNPESSVANFELARLYFQNNDFEAALTYGKKAQSLKPENYWYNYLLAILFERVGDIDNSIKYYQLSFPKNPTPQDYIEQYDLFIRFRRIESAFSTLKKFEEHYGYSPTIGLRRASLFESKNDLKSAEAEFWRVIRIDSTDYNLYPALIEFYINHNKLSEAQQLQNKISQKSDDFTIGQLSQALICRNSGQMDCFYENLSGFFANDRSSSFEEKLSLLNDFLLETKIPDSFHVKRLFESLISNYPDEVKIHSFYSSYLMTIDDFDGAIEELKKCIDLDKSDFQYFAKIFRVYVVTENYTKMKEFANEASELYPDQAEVYLFSAVADTYMGNFDDAESNFQMAQDFGIELSNANNYYIFYQGVHSYFTNYKTLALAYFDKYFNTKDDNYYLLLQYAYFLIDSGESINRAETIIKQCSEYTNLNYYFYFVSAFLDLRRNQIDRAVSNIEKSLSLDDSKYYVHNMAGDIYQKSGNCDKAVSSWKMAIDRGGSALVLGKKITNCK